MQEFLGGILGRRIIGGNNMKIKMLSIVLCAAIIIPVFVMQVTEKVAPELNLTFTAKGDETSANTTDGYFEGQAIIGFYGPMAFTNTKIINDIAIKYGITLKDTNPYLSAALYEGVDDKTFLQLLTDSDIKYAERNYLEKISQNIPNDLSWAFQWGPRAIFAPEAWNTTTGDNTDTLKVAILDTGVDYNNSDISPNYLTGGYDWANDDDDPMDDNGHGTHCAGILGAAGNNTIGISGTTWRIKIIAEKTIPGGSWEFGQGVCHAVNQEVKIISYSGGGPDSVHKHQAVRFAFNHGRLFFAASGNAAGNIDFPANYPEVIAVGATDPNDNLAVFSNFGPNQELVAPGVDILSHGLNQGYLRTQIIYRDDDGDGQVSSNDVRLIDIPNSAVAANSVVAVGDDDEAAQWDLIGFQNIEMHVDPNNNNDFDPGELIYVDNGDNQVSIGDTRMGGFWSAGVFYGVGRVNFGDPDITDPLILFDANETHTMIRFLSGTSMACPHAAGVAALTWARNPDLSMDELRHILRSTADDLLPVGFDNNFGFGRINASACIDAASFQYSIEVTPATQTITQGGSVDYTITLSLIQGPSQNVDLKLDDLYPLNPALTPVIDPVSGTPPFQATLTLTATLDAAFLTEILRINSTYTIFGRDFVQLSNFVSNAITEAPGDLIWIKTSETDDGEPPREGNVHTSPDIWSTPDPPELGETNTLNVKVRNKEESDSGVVLVQAWFTDWSPFNNLLDLPTMGTETIDNIPPGGEETVSFSWFIPTTYPEHICVFAQAWRPGFEPFTNQFDVRNNNNIAQRNYNAVTPTSPYSTNLTIKNPTNQMLSLTLYATAPNSDWVVDFCRPSSLRGITMQTPLKIPAGEEMELELTIIPPEDYEPGPVHIWATIEGYENLYNDLSGFTFNVEKGVLDDEPDEPDEPPDIIEILQQNIKIVIAVAIVVLVIVVVFFKRR